MEENFLYNAVRYSFVYDCRKHDLAPNEEAFATDRINEMTNNELLQAISRALANLLEAQQ